MDDDIEVIVAAIQDYLSAHPSAADSARGIVTWWLGRSPENVSPALVDEALARLVERGIVTARSTNSGVVIYARSGA